MKKKKFKKRVRARQKKTLEAYTAARAQLSDDQRTVSYRIPRNVLIDNGGELASEVEIRGEKVTLVFDLFVEETTLDDLCYRSGASPEEIRNWPLSSAPIPLPTREEMEKSARIMAALHPSPTDTPEVQEQNAQALLSIDEELAVLLYPELRAGIYGFDSD
jgi:hypothetical protein